MDAVRVRRLSRWQAEDLREDLADLYVESSDSDPGEEYRDREAFLHRLAADVQQPGFDMLLAETTALAGCAFGFPVARDGVWWEGFDGDLPQNIEQLTASGHVFAITKILVHPHELHQGIAGLLQEQLLGDHEASLGASLVAPDDHVALGAYRSWG
ncbi:hypothetical protein ACFYNN_28995 [Streptomyces sp. NPDC006978]